MLDYTWQQMEWWKAYGEKDKEEKENVEDALFEIEGWKRIYAELMPKWPAAFL